MFKLSRIAILLPILILIVLRIPSIYESYWYGDEGIYAAVAHQMQQGKFLYKEVWDHKPPLIFLIFYPAALIGWQIGFPLLKISNILLGIATLCLTNQILKDKTNLLSRLISLCLLSYLLGSTLFEGNSINSEVVFIVFNLAAFTLMLHKKRFAVVGFLGFLSLMTKVPGFVEFVLFIFAYLIIYTREDGLKSIKPIVVKIMFGFIVPFILLLLYFYLNNALKDFLYANFIFNTIYSLHEDNYSTLFAMEIPNIFLKLFSLISVFTVGLYLYLKKKLTAFSFAISVLLTAQLFASLLSGKNYGHYFIQVLPGATIVLALMLKVPKKGVEFSQCKYILGLMVLLTPMLVVLKSIGEIPVYAPVAEYYSSFYKGYVLKDDLGKQDFWWRNGNGINETKNLSEYVDTHYIDYETMYIYSDKPWALALTNRKITNKYVMWFHLDYRPQHFIDETKYILNSDLFIADMSVTMIDSLSKTLNENFEMIGMYKNFNIYKNINRVSI